MIGKLGNDLDYIKAVTDNLVLYCHHHNTVKNENNDEMPYIYPNENLINLRKIISNCYLALDVEEEEKKEALSWLVMQMRINYDILNYLTNDYFIARPLIFDCTIPDNWRSFKCWNKMYN